MLIGRWIARALIILLASALSKVQADEFVAPYVQTVKEDVDLILELANVQVQDYLIDLGSGDGRYVIEAAKRGALAHGVELNPDLVALATKNAADQGVAGRTAFVKGDIFEADISNATVVTLYLFPEANLKLRPKLLAELEPGTRVVSNSFHMGDWEPDNRAQGRTSGGALLWIIPADVRGVWQMNIVADSYRFSLEQDFQKVRQLAENATQEVALSSIRLRGSQLMFSGTFDGKPYVFHCEVSGEEMTGIAHSLNGSPKSVLHWSARRTHSAAAQFGVRR